LPPMLLMLLRPTDNRRRVRRGVRRRRGLGVRQRGRHRRRPRRGGHRLVLRVGRQQRHRDRARVVVVRGREHAPLAAREARADGDGLPAEVSPVLARRRDGEVRGGSGGRRAAGRGQGDVAVRGGGGGRFEHRGRVPAVFPRVPTRLGGPEAGGRGRRGGRARRRCQPGLIFFRDVFIRLQRRRQAVVARQRRRAIEV